VRIRLLRGDPLRAARMYATGSDDASRAATEGSSAEADDVDGGQPLVAIPKKNKEKNKVSKHMYVRPGRSVRNKDMGATIFFPYPDYLNLADTGAEQGVVPWAEYKGRDNKLPRPKLRWAVENSHEYNSCTNAFGRAGVHKTNVSGLANVLWSTPLAQEKFAGLVPGQRTNHFPGSGGIGHKVHLKTNLNNLRRKMRSKMTRTRINPKNEFKFAPQGFSLPEERILLQAHASKNPRELLIAKPPNSSCGKGIKVIRADQVGGLKKDLPYLVQKYIDNPFLINKRKFDLRVYVVCTSFNPLKVHMFRDGLVRFCTSEYKLDRSKLRDTSVHLTNYSLNKKSADYVKNDSATANPDDESAMKWSHVTLRKWFQKNGIDDVAIWASMADVIIKTLLSIEGRVSFNLSRLRAPRNCCFELFGFDIMLDEHLQPHLLEVNTQPSLSSSSTLDKRIKVTLMADTFNLIGVCPVDVKTAKGEAKQKARGKSRLSSRGSASPSSARNRAGGPLRLNNISDQQRLVIQEYGDERARGESTHFDLIFPTKQNCRRYNEYFDIEREANTLIQLFLHLTDTQKQAVLANKKNTKRSLSGPSALDSTIGRSSSILSRSSFSKPRTLRSFRRPAVQSRLYGDDVSPPKRSHTPTDTTNNRSVATHHVAVTMNNGVDLVSNALKDLQGVEHFEYDVSAEKFIRINSPGDDNRGKARVDGKTIPRFKGLLGDKPPNLHASNPRHHTVENPRAIARRFNWLRLEGM
jgi:hypothetical protein